MAPDALCQGAGEGFGTGYCQDAPHHRVGALGVAGAQLAVGAGALKGHQLDRVQFEGCPSLLFEPRRQPFGIHLLPGAGHAALFRVPDGLVQEGVALLAGAQSAFPEGALHVGRDS